MNSKILLIIIILVVAVGGFMVLGGKKENPTPSVNPEEIATPTQIQPKEETTTVTLTDAGFTPKDITVKATTMVIWTNSSGKTATVDSADHPTHRLNTFLNLGEFTNGSSLQVVFDNPGKYNYHNHFNASENGTVTVE